MPSSVACAHCGEPVYPLGRSTLNLRVYHGPCWRELHPPLDPPGTIHHSSHEERVQEGIEQP